MIELTDFTLRYHEPSLAELERTLAEYGHNDVKMTRDPETATWSVTLLPSNVSTTHRDLGQAAAMAIKFMVEVEP